MSKALLVGIAHFNCKVFCPIVNTMLFRSKFSMNIVNNIKVINILILALSNADV